MKLYFITLALIINFAVSTVSMATSMLPINLQQLSTRASLIIYAEVLNNETARDENTGTIVTYTTFKIIDLIKGTAGETHTIKQIGGTLADGGITYRIHGVPKFLAGKQYVVFLPEQSQYGFCSPLGLHQGSYNVTTIDGIKTINKGGNTSTQQNLNANSVTLPLAINATKPTQARLNDFVNTIRAFNTQ